MQVYAIFILNRHNQAWFKGKEKIQEINSIFSSSCIHTNLILMFLSISCSHHFLQPNTPFSGINFKVKKDLIQGEEVCTILLLCKSSQGKTHSVECAVLRGWKSICMDKDASVPHKHPKDYRALRFMTKTSLFFVLHCEPRSNWKSLIVLFFIDPNLYCSMVPLLLFTWLFIGNEDKNMGSFATA